MGADPGAGDCGNSNRGANNRGNSDGVKRSAPARLRAARSPKWDHAAPMIEHGVKARCPRFTPRFRRRIPQPVPGKTMPIRRRRTKSLAVQAAELSLAVPQVVAHRIARMAAGGTSPSARDRKEFHAMGAEKIAAFTESWNAMALQAVWESQRMAWSAMRSLWFPWHGTRTTARRERRQVRNAASGILRAGMAPVHRRAVANSKRLGRAKRRR